MATVKRPPTFDPNHRNRAVIEAGGTAPASGALVSRTDRLVRLPYSRIVRKLRTRGFSCVLQREDLGFDEGNLPLSDSGEEEDEADEDPRARPSGEAALKQKISRLEQELDDLAGKLSKVWRLSSRVHSSFWCSPDKKHCFPIPGGEDELNREAIEQSDDNPTEQAICRDTDNCV